MGLSGSGDMRYIPGHSAQPGPTLGHQPGNSGVGAQHEPQKPANSLQNSRKLTAPRTHVRLHPTQQAPEPCPGCQERVRAQALQADADPGSACSWPPKDRAWRKAVSSTCALLGLGQPRDPRDADPGPPRLPVQKVLGARKLDQQGAFSSGATQKQQMEAKKPVSK